MAKRKRKVAKYEIDRDGEGLRAFPREVLGQTDAEELSIYGVFDYRTRIEIPDAISKMKNLRLFTMGLANIRELPEGLCKLSKLDELSLDYAEQLRALPKNLGKLSSLRTLTMSYSHKLKALTDSIGKLSKLETLTTEPGGLTSVPASLWNATSLKNLTLPEGVKKLPPGISKLRKLESLSAHPSAIASIAKELPNLTALKSLRIWGKAKSVPAEIGELASLEVLEILYSRASRSCRDRSRSCARSAVWTFRATR